MKIDMTSLLAKCTCVCMHKNFDDKFCLLMYKYAAGERSVTLNLL